MFFAPSKSRLRGKIGRMGVSQTSDHNQIKIKTSNPSQDPPASSKASNPDLKDIKVLCTFTLVIENQNLERGFITDQ